MSFWLTRIPTKKEMKTTIDKLHDDKAPDPNDFTIRIFNSVWNMIKTNLLAGHTHLFMGWNRVREMNHTLTILIPK